jgi:hypothetical protein
MTHNEKHRKTKTGNKKGRRRQEYNHTIPHNTIPYNTIIIHAKERNKITFFHSKQTKQTYT